MKNAIVVMLYLNNWADKYFLSFKKLTYHMTEGTLTAIFINTLSTFESSAFLILILL